MPIPLRKRLIIILLCLSALSFIPGIPSFLRIGCGFIQTFYLPGFLFLFFLGNRRSPGIDDVFIPPVLSPIIISLLVAAAFGLTRSLDTSLFLSLMILYALLIIGLVLRYEPFTAGPLEAVPVGAAFVSLILCGMIAVFYATNAFLLRRSDALLHAPIVGEILDHGIPPLEPRLPDTPLRYPWFYHLFIASVMKLAGLRIFPALGLLNVMNAFAFPYLIARITAHFTKRRIHVSLTPVLAIAGLSSASWILWPIGLLRLFAGEVRGREEAARILGEVDLHSYRVVFSLTPQWLLIVNNLDKLLTITPYTYAINLFLLCFALVLGVDFQKKAPVRAAVAIAFVMMGTFLIHVVTGIVLLLTAFGAGILMLLYRRLRKAERPPAFQAFVIPGLALLVGIVGVPYFRSLTGVGGEGLVIGKYLHLGIRSFATILAPLVGLCFIVKPLVTYASRAEGVRPAILSAWILSLLIINAFVRLPGTNEAKFASLLFMLLVVPVSIALIDWLAAARGLRRATALIWVFILFLVPVILTARGFLLDRPESDALKSAYQPDEDCMRLYEWLRTETPGNSVIVEMDATNYTPLYAHRHTLLPFGSLDKVLGYTGETIDRPRAVHREIFSEAPLSQASIDYLRGLGRDLYLVTWTADVKSQPYLEAKLASPEPLIEKVYENPSGAVYRMRATAVRSGNEPSDPRWYHSCESSGLICVIPGT